MSDTLFVVPMRGGSKGLPGKHLFRLGGVPIAVRVLQTLRPLGDVVVSTDSDELAQIATEQGAEVIRRDGTLSGDAVPLDPVVFHAMMHTSSDAQYVATIQATSPLLTTGTIARCQDAVRSGAFDTALTVRDDRHVAWTGSVTSPHLATEWANRQYLAPRWVMTGGCVVTQREFVTPTRRFGGRMHLVEVSGAEAVDLDTPQDWAVAEWYAGSPTARELLTTRVLGDKPHWRGLVAILSAWDESPEESEYRSAEVITGGRVVRLRGEHTADEAEMALDAVRQGETDITIVTSAYHAPRAFLTFLRAMANRQWTTVRLWNAPAPSRMDKLADEWRKIATYTDDVATYEEGLAYLDWRDA